MIRKDYKRQLVAFVSASIIALLLLAFIGVDAWVGVLILWVVSYAAAYHALLQFDATAKVADSDKL